jgi:hypothetical protein
MVKPMLVINALSAVVMDPLPAVKARKTTTKSDRFGRGRTSTLAIDAPVDHPTG